MTDDFSRPATPLDDPLDPTVAREPTAPPHDTPVAQGGEGGVADRAKSAAGTAGEAGGTLLEHAKEGASDVTGEARRQVGDLWSQARGEVSDQVGTQQQRLAGGLQTFGGDLHRMAGASDEQGVAADLARQLGGRADDLGRWLEEHGPDDVLDEVRSFARRRPGTFLLVAAGAGLLVGRLARALKDASGDDAPTSTTGGSTTGSSSAGVRTTTSSPVRSSTAGATVPRTSAFPSTPTSSGTSTPSSPVGSPGPTTGSTGGFTDVPGYPDDPTSSTPGSVPPSPGPRPGYDAGGRP
ncbi:hypothetical protein KIN34_10445 [Cellulomonas sp. DKR-3]|uniref:Uncharacterized protein n=1 Tax=Cellulomonas fulva TaxID=2835530 RepID=A0ABS5TZZ3_9CELL|nr:hypothetical protein [Cellulomonas fulva]MBT0994704.1 hypothetical protein [Cellulomonas fulva]